jgi:predicted protein tyrosine phosphatase
MPKNYLFICQYNRNRSPFAAAWFEKYCTEQGIDAAITSAGMQVSHPTSVQLNREMVASADRIIVMEEYMKDDIVRKYGALDDKIVSLEIPDIFSKVRSESSRFYDENVTPQEAVKVLKEVYAKYHFKKYFNSGFFSKLLEAKLEDIIG